jgi:hypothetical protein
MVEHRNVDVVSRKCRSAPFQADLRQPFRNRLRRRHAHDANSLSKALSIL